MRKKRMSFIQQFLKEGDNIMKKILISLTAFATVICDSSGSTLSTSFRHGLQFSYEMLNVVNNAAIEASEKPKEQLDIVVSGMPVGKFTQAGQAQIYAFRDMKFDEISNTEALIDRMKTYEHEIILTGYGKGANFAARVAQELSKHITKKNKVKLFAFCADKIIKDDLSGISMLSRLHFSRYTEWQCRNSSMIEFPQRLSRILFDKFSSAGCIMGSSACLAGEIAISRSDLPSFLGVIPIGGAILCSFCKRPQKYLTMADIWRKYDFAGYRLSFALPEEYKDLGLP